MKSHIFAAFNRFEHIKRMNCYKFFGLLLLLLHVPAMLSAQIELNRYQSDYRVDSTRVKALYLDMDNLFFFKNNEYHGTLMKGYTLPGAWVNPKFTYQPLSSVKIEAGAYMLMYSGAYKYPNYAYQDISKWKGGHYQKGMHLLPYFRGQLSLGRFNFVLGSLYGGSNHRLMLPLYNPELNLTADPESGFQLLYDSPRFHLDAWINWQSFIFETDTHQEAFIAGLSSEIRFNSPQSKLHLYAPIQFVTQHRGGEQDDTGNVETLMNGAAGLGLLWNVGNHGLRRLNWEMSMLGYYQQKGKLWPFNDAWGVYARMKADFKYWSVQSGVFACEDFISLLGNPHFGAVSTKYEGGYNGRPVTAFLTADYMRTYAKLYSFGIKGELYHQWTDKLVYAGEGPLEDTGKNWGASIGVYFRLNLSFLLKRFK